MQSMFSAGMMVEGRYRLERPASDSIFGPVWIARDEKLGGREVSLWFLRGDAVADPAEKARFEARIADPSAARVLDRGMAGMQPFFVAELSVAALPPTRAMPAVSPYAPTAPAFPAARAPNPFQPQPGVPVAASSPQAGNLFGATVIGVLAILVACALAFKLLWHPRATDATTPAVATAPPPGLAGIPQRDATRIPVGRSPVRGDASARVTIVEFADFQCPFCGRVQTTLDAVRARYGNDVRIVFKNNPLPFHTHAMEAAEAALAAGAQGHFWEMHDLLYGNQQHLERTDLESYAARLGLNVARFRSDLDSHMFASRIADDQALARTLSANGTPNFFINGRQLTGAQPLNQFTDAIDDALRRSASIVPPWTVYQHMVDDPSYAAPTPPPPPPVPSTPTPSPTTVYAVPVGHSPQRGPADALVTIVEFGDFQCPFCGRAEATLEQLMREYGRDLRVVWKNNPLAFHTNAMPSAEAAMEVYRQQGPAGFWRYHDTLYAHQSAIGATDLESYAIAQGVDMVAFRAANASHDHRAAIDADTRLASALGASGTPTFFINGRILVGAQPVERFRQSIDDARREALTRIAGGTPRARIYDAIVATGVPTVTAAPGTTGSPRGSTVHAIPPSPSSPSIGPASAPVVLEHFCDFQSPFCPRIVPTFEALRRRYGSRIRIVWRNYPMAFHPHAMEAAEAALAVRAQQGDVGFWHYHDTLYDHQQQLERADLERYASDQGVDLARFRAAIDTHAHAAEIQRDRSVADATGETIGTPATFVNGHFVSGAVPEATFEAIIDGILGP